MAPRLGLDDTDLRRHLVRQLRQVRDDADHPIVRLQGLESFRDDAERLVRIEAAELLSDEASVMIPRRPGRFGANVNFWAIRPPVPPQDRLGCHDSRHVLLDPATESLALGGEASALIIRQPDASRLRVVLENTGSGGGGSVKTIEKRGRANLPGGVGASSGLHLVAANMGRIPIVALGLGSVAGLGRVLTSPAPDP